MKTIDGTEAALAPLAAVAAGILALALFPSAAAATPAPVPAAGIPGCRIRCPARSRPTAKAGRHHGPAQATPDTGAPGTPFTLSGSGLAAGKDVSIVWMTSNVNWILDARPDSVDYIGQSETKGIGVVLGTTTTDAKGAFSIALKAPRDFGAIHDVYAVIDGVQVAKGGYLISRTLRGHAAQGPCRHADHDQDRRPRLDTVRRFGERLVGRPVRRRRHRQVDARRGDRPDPGGRPGRQARAADRHGHAVQLPEHPAVADPVGDRRDEDVRGHEGRRPAGGPHRLAAVDQADRRHADDGVRRPARVDRHRVATLKLGSPAARSASRCPSRSRA